MGLIIKIAMTRVVFSYVTRVCVGVFRGVHENEEIIRQIYIRQMDEMGRIKQSAGCILNLIIFYILKQKFGYNYQTS